MKERLCKHGKWQNRFLSLVMACALVVATLFGQSFPSVVASASNSTANVASQSSSDTSLNHADRIKDGAILHAWCWSFNTIKNNMAAIANAGYTSIQTSPVNACVVGNGGDLKFNEQWYYHYQPTDYTIGNYQLGSESEFAAMCAEAEKYGVKIIVDVVANHCTSSWELISNNIKNISNAFHTNQEIKNWNDRREVTQLALLGLYDNNTQNKALQNYIKQYMNRCLSLGADGFRYDAAKHIELPDDPGYGGDFWPTILNNNAEFQYGETLQDSISRESSYANYMGVTASTYGKNMRDAIGANDFSTSRVMDYAINVSPDKIVTWVESHDNYANAIHEWGSSQWMNDEQIKLTWAAVAARKGGTPLFFSRPVGGGGQTWDNRFPNLSKMGDRGSALFMDDEVAAVNKFRNAMVGQNEYLRNPNGNSKILMIERGTKGAVIINLNYSDTYISSTTNLANGSYDNKTDNNNVFTVTNSRITGTLPARSVVVLYNTEPDEPVEPSVMNIYFQKPSSWNSTVYAYVYDESGSTVQKNASWPGAPMSYDSATGYYKYSYLNSWSQPKVIFSDGTNQTPGANLTGYTVKNNTLYNTNGEAGTVTVTPSPSPSVSPSVTPPTNDKIYFSKPSDWGNTVYAYVYDESGSSVVTNASWPGIAMTCETNGEYSYILNSNVTSTSKVIFNDGSKQTSKNGFAIVKNGHYDSNGIIGGTTANKITIYYKTNWSSANIHYKIGNGSWTTVPGVKMSSSDRTGYQVITIDLGTATTLTACFNNGNGTWDSKNGSNYFFDSIGTYTVADGVITKQ